MCTLTSDFDAKTAGFSPDRVDALVWGFTELMIGPAADGWVTHFANLASQRIEEVGQPLPAREPVVIVQGINDVRPIAPPTSYRIVAPQPYMNLAPAQGIRYTSGPDGIIEDVRPEHLAALMAAGCQQAAQ